MTTILLTCAACGDKFLRKPFRFHPNLRPFCSRRCYQDSREVKGLTKNGYRLISVDGRRVYEHRWLMEQHLGRKLLRTELVHHINGRKADNRLKNLKVVDRIAHAKEHLRPLSWDIERARTLYRQGMGYGELAELSGVAHVTIRYAFLKRGWHIHGRRIRQTPRPSS